MPFPRIKYARIAKEEENHSQGFIEETLAYAEELERKNLPVIFSTKHLALLIGIKYEAIEYLILNREEHYKFYEIKKRRGGKRPISSPHRVLKLIQQWINKSILACVEIDKNAYGFCANKSILDNASVHVGQDFTLNIDLLKFFETVVEERVYGIFKSLGYHNNLAVDLAKLCTVCDNYSNSIPMYDFNEHKLLGPIFKGKSTLPQGAPTSPSLSNIITRRLDKRLSGYALKNNLKYSRYADDITFSWNEGSNIKRSTVFKIIQEEGFFINHKKVRFYSKSSNKHIVTGLIVSNVVKVPKKFKKEIERHLFFCKKYGVQSHLGYLIKKYPSKKFGYLRGWIEGKIRFIYMIEPIEGAKLFEEYNNIDWGI